MPAHLDIGREELHRAVDLLLERLVPVMPQPLPGHDLRIGQQQPQEGDESAVTGRVVLAASQPVQRQVALPGPVRVDAPVVPGAHAVRAEAIRAAVAGKAAVAEHVAERAVAFRAEHQAVQWIAFYLVFYQAEPPGDVIGISYACVVVPAAPGVNL